MALASRLSRGLLASLVLAGCAVGQADENGPGGGITTPPTDASPHDAHADARADGATADARVNTDVRGTDAVTADRVVQATDASGDRANPSGDAVASRDGGAGMDARPVGTCATSGDCAGQTCCAGHCANTTSDGANCGACGTVCGAATNAPASTCVTSACVPTCAAGFGDCDHLAANGCEVVTGTSSANCGACGNACPSGMTCTNGACAVGPVVCASGTADCDHNAANACEVNLATDPNNCGACGAHPAETCSETGTARDENCNGLVDEGYGIALTDDGFGDLVVASVCEPMSCTGTGRIQLFPDSQVDDYGDTSRGDGLEIYCFNSISRFCLTGEACPWRGTLPSTDDGHTCSYSGLSASHNWALAQMTNGGIVFPSGHVFGLFYCPPATGRLEMY